MKKIIRILAALLCMVLLATSVAAHPGRTDANEGHHDYKNRSGLGSYHYHCGENPPHLHPGGVCPYGNNSSVSQPVYTPPSPSIKISSHPTELNVGDTQGVEYTVENANSSLSTVVSSNENVVRVNEDKTLTAVGEGTATITVSGSGAAATFDVTVKTVPVASISINNMPEKLQLDTTAVVMAAVLPDNATDKSVEWKSSDESIAEIDQEGKITAKKSGNVTIYCKAKSGIEVQAPLEIFEVFPEEIKTNAESIRLEGGEQQTLEVEILPENTNNKKYQIAIENKSVAEVQEDNRIYAMNDGNTEIVIRAGNNVTKKIPLTVYHIPVEQVEIDDSELDYIYTAFLENVVDVNSQIELTARVYPEDATFLEISWESSNPEVISVEGEDLTINGAGDVILTAKSHDEATASIKLTVVSEKMITGIFIGGGVVCLIFAGAIVYCRSKRNKDSSDNLSAGNK